ncbi:acetate--CoA ligase family protein [Arthrobacter sp. I2-34]|uniref:Acetate--CoA ligase family protein n=1 Tax=Arthrobacter hankyongi TaxID=2904801 RepID=A0ABS9L9Q3_9MICC|nr:acetate--CoA ligase family protein [Arthrobacter hankyongi]MCG2623409.1 acetate--CoA ligase family protein [Arthrobacter hankyongi]
MTQLIDAGPDRRHAPLLDRLLQPRSVALVGATDRSRWSSQTFENLRRYSPQVPVYCVSPKGGTVHGVRAYTSLAEIGAPVDLAYVMTPRETVPGILRQAGAAGARAAVVLTAGFGETPDGKAYQAAAVEAAAEAGVALLGPNGNGFINVHDSVVPFGLALPRFPLPGPASFVLQSGGLVKPVLSLADAWGAGVGVVACTGNEAALTAADVAAALLDDERTGAVGLFLETIRDTEAFRHLARKAVELDKPVVALTVGRSDAARRAAQAHTGALAADAAVSSAVLKSLGVVEVSSVEELVAATDLLARGVRPRGPKIAVVGASGGACELVAEKASALGLTVPELPEACVAALAEVLPDISQAQNPLDVTGFATVDPMLPVRALEAMLATADTDAVLFQAFVLPPDDTADPNAARAYFAGIARAVRSADLPVLLQDEVSAPVSGLGRSILDTEGLVRLAGIEVGITALAHAVRWTASRRALLSRQAEDRAAVVLARPDKSAALSEFDALRLLAAGGVPVIPQTLATCPREAVQAAAALKGPAVLKVCSPDIAHKSDIGGVVLNVQGEAAVAAAYNGIMNRVPAQLPEARIDGVLVSPMRSGGIELIAGINRDPVWGPVLLLGMGGVLVEVLKDVALRPLPVTRADIAEMLAELRAAPLLHGVRGQAPIALEALADAVLALTDVAAALGGELQSIEINPLRADHTTVEALDALIVWADDAVSDVEEGESNDVELHR